MPKKAVLGLLAGLAGIALAVIIFGAIYTAPKADPGVVSRPATDSEMQPPPKPKQLKPDEHVVVTGK